MRSRRIFKRVGRQREPMRYSSALELPSVPCARTRQFRSSLRTRCDEQGSNVLAEAQRTSYVIR